MRRPLVIEIVGPAGAGKTTLQRALSHRYGHVVTEIPLGKLGHVPTIARYTVQLLPTFLAHYRHSRWFTWRELRSMVYVEAWHRRLSQQAAKSRTVIVLDHGPVFRLVTLRAFGPEIVSSRIYQQWWDSMLERWTLTLSAIVWLDAPTPVLAQRINARGGQHRMKGKPAEEACAFLARYSTTFEEVIARLGDGLRLLRFDTDRESTARITDEVLEALGLRPGGVAALRP